MKIRHCISTILCVASIYGALTIALTYPLGLNLNRWPDPLKADTSFWLWNTWWVNKSIGQMGSSPFFTDYIFHPTGVDLSFHPFSFYNTLLSIPLTKVLGLIAAYNLLILLAFFVAALGMFFLARDQGISVKASLAAGFFYGFSPYHFGEFGRLDSTSIHWIPFALLFMLRLYRGGKLSDAVLAGVFLSLVALCSYYYMIFVIILFFLLLAYTLSMERGSFQWKPFFRNSAVLFGIFLAIILPSVVPLVTEVMENAGTGPKGPALLRTDLLGLIRGTPGQNAEFIAWPVVFGFGVCVFSLYALFKVQWKDKGLWIFLGICFFILGLGPRLIIGGETVPFVRLPQALFYHLPVLDNIRAPYRFMVIVSLTLSVLSGYGIDAALKRASRIRNHIRFLLVSVVPVVLIAEVWMPPLPVKQVQVPEFYRNLARENGRFALFEVPRSPGAWSSAMFYQTFHEKPIVGGFTGYSNPEILLVETSPVLSALCDMEIDRLGDDNQGVRHHIVSTLRKLCIRYVVVRLEHWRKQTKKDRKRYSAEQTGPALSPLAPAAFRRHHAASTAPAPDDLRDSYLSSKESRDFEDIFGEPVFLDHLIAVYRIGEKDG